MRCIAAVARKSRGSLNTRSGEVGSPSSDSANSASMPKALRRSWPSCSCCRFPLVVPAAGMLIRWHSLLVRYADDVAEVEVQVIRRLASVEAEGPAPRSGQDALHDRRVAVDGVALAHVFVANPVNV